MDCVLHEKARRRLHKMAGQIMPAFYSLPKHDQFEVLLYGADNLDVDANVELQRAVELFTHSVNELTQDVSNQN